MAETIGAYIKARMKELGLKQREVAEKIHRDQKTVQSLTKSSSVGSQRLVELSEVLNCNLFEFFTLPGGPLEQFAPESSEEIHRENEALKATNTAMEAEMSRLRSELSHQNEMLTYLKQTLEVQQAYIKNMTQHKSEKGDTP